MTNDVFPNPPVAYPSTRENTALVCSRLKSVKIAISVGILILIIVSGLVILSMKIISGKRKSEGPPHQPSSTIDPTITSTIKNDEMDMFNCTILFNNAIWNNSGTIFVNRFGTCGSDHTSLCNPDDLFIDQRNQNLYVVDKSNDRIQKYSLTESLPSDQGAIGTTVASQGLIRPSSIFVDSHTENMYILNYNKKKIGDAIEPIRYRVHFWEKNAKSGRIIIEEEGEYLYGTYSHLTLDQELNIYVGTRSRIRKWLASTNYTRVITVAGKIDKYDNFSNTLHDPRGFLLDRNLTMYIIDWGNHRIQKWPADADQATTLDSDLLYPYDIIQDCTGNLYYTDYYRSVVYRWNVTSGERTSVIGNYSNSRSTSVKPISNPMAMSFDRFGNMFVIDGIDYQIKKFAIL